MKKGWIAGALALCVFLGAQDALAQGDFDGMEIVGPPSTEEGYRKPQIDETALLAQIKKAKPGETVKVYFDPEKFAFLSPEFLEKARDAGQKNVNILLVAKNDSGFIGQWSFNTSKIDKPQMFGPTVRTALSNEEIEGRPEPVCFITTKDYQSSMPASGMSLTVRVSKELKNAAKGGKLYLYQYFRSFDAIRLIGEVPTGDDLFVRLPMYTGGSFVLTAKPLKDAPVSPARAKAPASGMTLEQALNAAPLTPYRPAHGTFDERLTPLMDSIIKPGMSTYQKVQACYAWLEDNMTYGGYGKIPKDGGGPGYFSYAHIRAYEALISRSGQCDSYAGLLMMMMRYLGLDAYMAFGEVAQYGGGYGLHKWVELDLFGKTYIFDPQIDQLRFKRGEGRYGLFGTTYEAHPKQYVFGSRNI